MQETGESGARERFDNQGIEECLNRAHRGMEGSYGSREEASCPPCAYRGTSQHEFRTSVTTFVPTELFELYGEFDPGSGRTLAARLTHASRTGFTLRGGSSGERVRNT